MATHVIVLASRTATAPELIDALVRRGKRGPIAVTLVLPASGPGRAARATAERRLAEALRVWREAGVGDCDGVVSDPAPLEALAEVWDPLRHDELIVATLPGQSSRWIASDLPGAAARFAGVPVRHVVARDPERELHVVPAPAHEHEPLGPLAVMAWGRRGEW